MSSENKTRLAIIGAGPSGLAAAWKLRDDEELEITVFDKSRGVSGRAASRTRHGVRLDPGANYFRTDLPDISDLIHHQLPTNDLVEILGDIDVFDADGAISAGDPKLNLEKKWTYRNGISTIGKLLAEASGCNLRSGIRVHGIRQNPESQVWILKDEAGERLGYFDAVLIAIPAPQALDLLAPEDVGIAAALAPATYQRQWTFTFGYDSSQVSWPGDSYALINLDRAHDIAWLSRENAKLGRIPEDTLAVMAQMSPRWSAENFDRPPEELAVEVNQMLASFLDCKNDLESKWFDFQGWKFSLPTGQVNLEKAREVEACGIYLAGDALVGKGRVTEALQTGLDVADRIRDRV